MQRQNGEIKMNSNKTPIILAQSILSACPVSSMILDENGNIVYINQSFEGILGVDHNVLLGADHTSIPREDLKSLFTDNSEVVLCDANGVARTFQHSQRAINKDTTDGFVVHYYLEPVDDALKNDNAQLHEELTDLKLTNVVTGLSTERALIMVLESQVSRSRRYSNPLSIVKILVKFDQETIASDDSSKQCQLMVSRLLKDQLRWADVIGQLSPQEYVIVLPETDKSAANAMVGKVSENLAMLKNVESVFFGITDWKKGDIASSLLHRADEALTQAQNEDELSAVVL